MPDERLRVLVIDDDADLTASVAAILSANGYEALTANSGEQGLELAFTGHPHLILLDVTMPGMDGHQVCRELQFGYTKDIPVVFLTAKTELSHMMEANRSGASAYVTKPFQPEHLLRTIADVLRDASVYHDEITGLPTLANVQVEVQRMLFDHGQLGVIYVNVDGVHALEQLQGFEVVDDVYRVVGQGPRTRARRADPRRGLRLGLEPRRRVPHRPLALPAHRVRRRGRPAAGQAAPGEGPARAARGRAGGAVCSPRSTSSSARRGSRSRPRSASSARCWTPSSAPPSRSRRSATRSATAAARSSRRSWRGSCSPACSSRSSASRTSRRSATSCSSRGPLRERAAPAGRALRGRARRGSRHRARPPLPADGVARPARTLPPDCLRFVNTEPLTMFLHSHGDSFVQEFVDATPSSLRGLTVIEITENSVIDDFDRMRDVVRKLREHGFRIAIDDAGAGYAGLQTMVEIEPDFIKLDMSLIRGVDTSIVKQKLVKHAARLLPARPPSRSSPRASRPAGSSTPCRSSASRTGRASSSAFPARTSRSGRPIRRSRPSRPSRRRGCW